MAIKVECEEKAASDDEMARLVILALFGKSVAEVAKDFLVSEEVLIGEAI